LSGVGAIFGEECQKRGMLVRVAGDAIMMSPTLIMTPGEVDEVCHQRFTVPANSPLSSSLASPRLGSNPVTKHQWPCLFSVGAHLRGSPQGHGGEGGSPAVQEELAKRATTTITINAGRRRPIADVQVNKQLSSWLRDGNSAPVSVLALSPTKWWLNFFKQDIDVSPPSFLSLKQWHYISNVCCPVVPEDNGFRVYR
jgi:hypothetical protein